MAETQHVFVTRRIPERGLALLAQHCTVEVSDIDGVLPREILLQKVSEVDGILCLLNDRIDRAVIEQAGPRLKVISNYAVGYNNIDVQTATNCHILITNTPGVLTETTADLAWGLLMDCARRIGEGDRLVRNGQFHDWGPLLLLGSDVYQGTLGIVGMGRIGQAMARRARGFSMKTVYASSRQLAQEVEHELSIEWVSLDQLLQVSDFVSLHVPLTDQTHHLISKRELKLMKREGFLINTARGPVVDEKALVQALEQGWIAGAGLDVFENEPSIEPGLLQSEHVVMTPHIGSASRTTREKMAVMASENLIDALQGRMPSHPVNPEALITR